MSDKKTTIIETRAQSILRDVIHQVVDGAGLALVRGPAGIGKTFALDLIEGDLVEAGVRVIRVTATPAIEGSLSAFAREALAGYGLEAGSTTDAVESLWSLLEGFPFRDYGPRTLLMVDESQGLKTSILEMIRALWDRGTHARLGMASGPAFGCVLIGNDQFMSKGGHVRTASFRPLLSRVTHNLFLQRPASAEYNAMATMLFPDHPEHRAVLEGFGAEAGNLRQMQVAKAQAGIVARGNEVTVDHLRRAILMMGGK